MSTKPIRINKREEFKLRFHKNRLVTGDITYTVDANAAPGQYKDLAFIDSLEPVEIYFLIEQIEKIKNNQPYDPSFLKASEVFILNNIQFNNPTFLIGGQPVIHMDDLKILLQEWLAFIKS